MIPWQKREGYPGAFAAAATASSATIAGLIPPSIPLILMLNLIMVTVGMFLDLPAAILLLGPTFVAIGNAIGLDLIQLGIMMAVNLSMGLFTPPVGTTLFIAAAISRDRVGAVVRELWPFYLVAITVLALISFVPAFTLY
ncbi:TRAP transporter large permease subunit [Thauera butanivorans]|uniref:TRAP transporter large permease subunit n=1 Tax=Thauera butanivorans TaxID=86174 RepID=UPI00083964AA|nr:TRAP transporter large permease subunit [Thauera butanivorans]